MRRSLTIAAFLLSLSAIQGLAIVQSTRYLQDFVTYSGIPGLLYITAFLVGAAIGWAVREMRLLLVVPLAVLAGATLVFAAVAYSPVWLGDSPHSVAVINELTRQAVLIMFLSAAPLYLGAFGGMLLREARS